jgi:O-antigen ligase
MNQNSLFLDKINGFIISILLLGQHIVAQLAYIRDRESTTETIILIIITLSVVLFFYWKDLRSKNFFYDTMFFLCIFCLYYLYVYFFTHNFPIFLFILLFLSIVICYKKGIRNKNYLFLFLIFFIMLFALNIIIVGVTNGAYSEAKIKGFLLYSVGTSFYIIAIVNKQNLIWAKKFLWYLCLFFLIISSYNYLKYNILYTSEVMKLSIGYISASFIFGAIFLYVFFEKLMFQGEKTYLFLLPILLFFMLLSGSRGPLASLLMTLSMYFFMTFNKKNIIFAVLILVFAIFFININTYFSIDSLVNRFPGFARIYYSTTEYYESGMQTKYISSGREYFYSKAIKEFYSRPIFGVGIGTDEIPGSYAHNSFLEIASQLGFFALFIFTLIIGIWVFQFYRSEKKRISKFRIFKYLFLYFLFHSLFSGSIFFNYSFWAILTISGVIFYIESKKDNMMISRTNINVG